MQKEKTDIFKQNLKNWEAKTPLELDVKKMILNSIENTNSYTRSFFDILLFGCGCDGGIINGLISNEDTTKFYEKHKDEIQNIMQLYMDNIGVKSPKEVFEKDWEEDDYFCNDSTNKTILSRFCFEQVALKISNELNMYI